MHETILAANWKGYEAHKTENGRDPKQFDGSELWEKEFLASLICTQFPKFHHNTVKIAIAYCVIIHGPVQPRDYFVERVMERVKAYY